jgi:bile acid:Na+ symporter, BASS family
MIRRVTRLFPLWAILCSLAAFGEPALVTPLKSAIIPLLTVVMFGMGMTLTFGNFAQVLRTPRILVIGIGLQYTIMPLAGLALALLLDLPPALLAGMVLVGCSPGGTASNVITYLARGDVALSIALTLTSTVLSIVMTPLLTFLLLHQTVPVPAWDMLLSILWMVLVPVAAGTVVNSLWGRRLERIQAYFPLLSSLAIVLIIAIIVGLNRANIESTSLAIAAAVILHNGTGLLLGYGVTRLLGYDARTCRTLGIEVGMQNSGLSVALAVKYFSTLAALPGALFSIWHNLSGSALASIWRRRDERTA